ncbi:amidase [Pseudothermotoga sp.]|jgi:aspartyl-tRNA(Asn)/glutamyl-tRNA(Gln) amidotransferase subunit A|uniref:amidase n=1 Tax=Pseudothermotoga sp. TaxID=2033661 RepID=UPI00258DFAC8|nr:amidase [Pseudothermotoga sp.]MDK2883984.1 aspartyl-tRNA(Asn)/glutamyl-tRNA(Gln) amidotransferase subunit [Pseudothermotoga sp.]
MFIYEIQKLIRKKEIKPSEVLEECIKNIEANAKLGAFITLTLDSAMKQAKKQDEMLKTADPEKLPPLFGIPIALKDLIFTKGIRTTGGSLFWKDFIPHEDAFIVKKLRKAGAIFIGKTNMHEIALGVTNNNPHFGPCLNPHDSSRISGGSSGGSAVAVASGMCLAAIGTDTGGSIRIPSALCGVVGFKPTYGRVSLRGIMPLAWHLDHAGPITKCVEDARIVLKVIEGYDSKDPFSIRMRNSKIDGKKTTKIKVAKGVGDFVGKADERILKLVDEFSKELEKLDMKIEMENTDWLKDVAAANGLMTQVEAAAFHRNRLEEKPEWFSEDVRERLIQGKSASGVEYALARHTQSIAKHRFNEFFKAYDLLLLPTVPVIAPPLHGEGAVELSRKLTRFTASFDITGLPAITIPYGKIEGLPVGVQLVAASGRDAFLLKISRIIEQVLANQ